MIAPLYSSNLFGNPIYTGGGGMQVGSKVYGSGRQGSLAKLFSGGVIRMSTILTRPLISATC